MLARIVAALALLLSPSLALPARAETIVMRPPAPITVAVRHGVTIKYLALKKPNTSPAVAVMLFAGGNGLLNLQSNGAIGSNLARNFLVRSRAGFVQRDLFVAVVDTPNQVAIDGNVRLSAQYAQDIGQVISDVRGRIAKGGKVWLVGTSAGTLSAAGVAAHLRRLQPVPNPGDGAGYPDGVVLSATATTLVKGYCGRTVFYAQLSAINVPALVVSHVDDACQCSPAKMAPKVIAALTGAPDKDSITVSGGAPAISKDACRAMTPHGFLGIEGMVVDAIAKWIKAH